MHIIVENKFKTEDKQKLAEKVMRIAEKIIKEHIMKEKNI